MQNTPLTRKVKYGNNVRQTFGAHKEVIEMPYLLEVQKKSYERFLKEGIARVLKEASPISDYSGKADVYFLDYTLDDHPKCSRKEAIRKGTNYTIAMRVKVRIVIKETGEVIENEVFLGDVPYMTEDATFIFNGTERVIINQIVRSPSAYYSKSVDKTGRELFSLTLMPLDGSWLEMEQKEKDPNFIRVSLDKKRNYTR